MAQVIIHTNDNGGVSVTVPTGEISIEAVKQKDLFERTVLHAAAENPAKTPRQGNLSLRT